MKEKKHSNAASSDEAKRFLKALDCTTETFCFQTFDDLKTRRDPRLAATVRGTMGARFEYLTWMNSQGAGIFIAVNSIKAGCSRKVENLERIRAVWQDDDDGFQGSYPILPSIAVQSSPGKFQRYWIADSLKPDVHQAIMRRLVHDYGSDPNACDLVRVLRLPGFFHMKNPEKPHHVELIEAPGWVYEADQLASAFPPIWAEPPNPKPFDGCAFDQNEFIRLLWSLSRIDADDRAAWLRVGMALRFEYGEAGKDLWDAWSATSPHKFNPKDQDRTWRSFKRSGGRAVTLGTIYHLAQSTVSMGADSHAQ